MKAVLLAGGYGTRLFPLSLRIPKVMVPVAGKPVLEHLINIVRNAGTRDVVISLNAGQHCVQDYFGDGRKFGVDITYVYEDSMSDEDKFGAIGAIQYALSASGGPSECVVINGDNIFYGLDLARLDEEHRNRRAQATIGLFTLIRRADVEQYGIVKVDEKGRVTRFQEKPKVDEAFSNLASAGVYRLTEAFVREYLPAYVHEQKARNRKPDRIGDLWAHLVEELPLYGHAFSGMWGDTNTPETYVNAHKQAMHFIVGGGVRARAKGRLIDSNKIRLAESAEVSEEATVKGPAIIEEGCVIEAGAMVGPGVHLGKGVRVGSGACVHGSVLFRDVVLGRDSHVTDAILDIGSVIGEGATVEEYAVVGYKSRVGKNARLTAHARLWPLLEVGAGSVVAGDVMIAEERISPDLKKDPLF